MRKVSYIREVKKARDSKSALQILNRCVREARDQGIVLVVVVVERPDKTYTTYISDNKDRRQLMGTLFEMAIGAHGA